MFLIYEDIKANTVGKFIETNHVGGEEDESEEYEDSLEEEDSEGLESDEESEPIKSKKKISKGKAPRSQLQKGTTKVSPGKHLIHPNEFDDEISASDEEIYMDMEESDTIGKTGSIKRERKRGKPKQPLKEKMRESSFEDENEEGEEMDMEVEEDIVVKRKTPKQKKKWPIQEEAIGAEEDREKSPINEIGLED